MDIKNEIGKTEKISNNLKRSHVDINKALVNFGGTNAQNLFKVPEILSSASNKNKKVAILNPKMRVDFRSGVSVDIPLNVSFYPAFIYIEFNKLANRINYMDVDSEYVGGIYERGGSTIIYDTDYSMYVSPTLNVSELTKQKITIIPKISGPDGDNRLPYIIERIVAIS